jgi:predicted alpha/beta superfamily hydrolase
MKIKHKSISIIILGLLIISNFTFGQVIKNDIVLGKRISIESKILNETRDLYIFLPEGYGQSDQSYPVLYVLDGRSHFFVASGIVNSLTRIQQIPATIVIGIPNTNRMLDFTPTLEKGRAVGGGADKFLGFMENELIPYIDKNYRTQSYKTLFGHSLCGMFSVYTLFNYPGLFNAYIAASPYLMYDEEYVIKKAEEALVNKIDFTDKLYLTIGNEPTYFNSLDKFTALLNKKKNGINWSYQKYEAEDHGSIPIKTILDGLGFIFSDWQLTNEIAMKGVEAIKEHFQNRIKKYGFTTELAEVTLNAIGYQLLQGGNTKRAIDVFEYNVELYPNSANVYDSLGDAYDAQGLKKKALKNYKMAVSIGEKINDPNLPAFKNNLERLDK